MPSGPGLRRQARRVGGGSGVPPPATGNWPRTIRGCAANSPKPSASSAPPASAPIRTSLPTIKGKLSFDNNRPLLATTISRHADSSKTLSPTSPPRSGHRVKKRLKITIVSGQDLTHHTTVTKVPPSTDVRLAPLGSPWLTLVVAEEGPR